MVCDLSYDGPSAFTRYRDALRNRRNFVTAHFATYDRGQTTTCIRANNASSQRHVTSVTKMIDDNILHYYNDIGMRTQTARPKKIKRASISYKFDELKYCKVDGRRRVL